MEEERDGFGVFAKRIARCDGVVKEVGLWDGFFLLSTDFRRCYYLAMGSNA